MQEQLVKFMMDIVVKLIQSTGEKAAEKGITFKQYCEEESIDMWTEIEEISDLVNELPESDIKVTLSEGLEEIIETFEKQK